MVSRLLKAGPFLLLAVSGQLVCAQSRSVEGTYRNPALGYSIRIPRGLKGVTGDQAGPERGVKIPLPSGSEIVVFGEPNSLEYKSPEEGIRSELKLKDCESGQQEIKQATVGRIRGARGRLVCGDRVLRLVLAFRPHGGPIYRLRLETTRLRETDAGAILEAVAATFRLIPWR